MPIIIKDITWSQTEDEVKIVVKIKSGKLLSTDVFTSPSYLKVHCPPYFWEVFLWHEIIDQESKCKIFDEIVQFHLKKREPIEWPALERESIDVEEKNVIRNRAISEAHNETTQQRKATAKYREEKKREEIMNATSRDAKSRTDLTEMLKVEAKTAVLQPILQKEQQEKPQNVEFLKPKPVAKTIDTPRPKARLPLPEVRKNGNISITFSDRNFVTPKRESQEHDEKEWLLKSKEARKAIGFVEEDLRPEERNPQWLKEKGDQLFEQKNYLGAISAYSTAIRLTDQYYELFLNRSAAHFQAENYMKCAEDCTKAYELLVPVCAANLQSRKDCLARRGAALVRLGLVKQGYDEVVAALKLDPTDKILERDAEMLRCKLERSN